MRDPDRVVIILCEWLAKAENDFFTACHLVRLGQVCPEDTVCFHVQQCVEKYLKTILILHDIDFPRTHEIGKLIKLIPRGIKVSLTMAQQRRLSEYAVEVRYPSEIKHPTVAEARKSVALMRKVRREVRRLLPKAALRRKKK